MSRGGRWNAPAAAPINGHARRGLTIITKETKTDRFRALFEYPNPLGGAPVFNTAEYKRFVTRAWKVIEAMQRPGEIFNDKQIEARFEVAVEIFGVLRGDMKWGEERALDHLAVYVPRHLLGGRSAWEPEARAALWVESPDAAFMPRG